jgi:hypothetical protein
MWNKKWSLRQLSRRIKAEVLNAARANLVEESPYQRRAPIVVIDLQLTLYSLTIRNLPEAQPAVKQLRFSKDLQRLALSAIFKIKDDYGVSAYNGMHARLEKDMGNAHSALGGISVFMQANLDTCGQAGFNTTIPVYVATGLLSYNDKTLWNSLKSGLESRYASRLFYKEMLISPEILGSLDSEQLAVLDFLILSQCDTFVGYALSTFSILVREFRAVHDIAPRSKSILVTKVGSANLAGGLADWCKAACFE